MLSESQFLKLNAAEQAEYRRAMQDQHRTTIRPRTMLERRNPEAFCLYAVTYYPHLIPEIEDWQVPSIEAMVLEDRVLIMWPAGTGKCVSGSTRVLLADGRYERIDALADGARVISYDGRNYAAMDAAWVCQGVKPTVRVTTHMGRSIVTTWEHPYLAQIERTGRPLRDRGHAEWRAVKDLKPGDRIAVPTSLPFFGQKQVPEHESGLLGLWLAEGSSEVRSVVVASANYGDRIQQWACAWGLTAHLFGSTSSPSWRLSRTNGGARPNPIAEWLRSLGLGHETAATKHVPAEVFTWDRDSVATFLHWLFNGDGWLSRRKGPKPNYQLGFVSKSEQLVRDVSHLLLRFGIVGRIRNRGNCHVWETTRISEVRRFVRFIGIDDRPAALEIEDYRPKGAKTEWQTVEFDPIVAIDECGEELVYDLCVPHLHNFVAEDIIAHNTTLFSIVFPLWLMQIDPDVEQLGVFKDDNEAKDSLRVIKGEMENNERLVADFGILRPAYGKGKWDAHRVDCAQRTRRGKQSSLMYFAYGSGILGQRSHRRFFDDIVTRDIAFSPELTRKQIQWFTVDFESGPYAPLDKASFKADFDQISGTMTRMAPKDLGNYLETRVSEEDYERNTDIRRFNSIVVDLIKDEEKHQTITRRWPWSMAMAKKAEMGPVAFAMRYRNTVIDQSTAIFKEVYMYGGEWNGINYQGVADKALTMMDAIKPGDSVVIGYDPQSGSETRWAKDAGIVMLALSPGAWQPKLADWHRGKSEVMSDAQDDSQVKIILRMAKRCNLVGIVPVVALEGNQIQRTIRPIILDRARQENIEVRVDVDFTSKLKWDKETGVEACALDFENADLRVPWAQPSDQGHFKGFLESMMEYGTSKYFDVPMAYWFARSLLKARIPRETARTVPMKQRVYSNHLQARMHRLGLAGRLTVVNAYKERAPEPERVM